MKYYFVFNAGLNPANTTKDDTFDSLLSYIGHNLPYDHHERKMRIVGQPLGKQSSCVLIYHLPKLDHEKEHLIFEADIDSEATIESRHWGYYLPLSLDCTDQLNLDINMIKEITAVNGTKVGSLDEKCNRKFTSEEQALIMRRIKIQLGIQDINKHKNDQELRNALTSLMEKVDDLKDMNHKKESFSMIEDLLTAYKEYEYNFNAFQGSDTYDKFKDFAECLAQGHPSGFMQEVGVCMLVVAAIIAATAAFAPAAALGVVGLGMFAYGSPTGEARAMNTVMDGMKATCSA